MNTIHRLAIIILAYAASAEAASLKHAEFTRVINDVRLLSAPQQAFPAKVGDQITGKIAVSTGAASRAELRFPDKTLTRIGANSVFKLDQADCTVNLEQGVILLQVPKQIGGAKVRTGAVTAAVTGTSAKVDLELLQKTSKLMDPTVFDPLINQKHLADALDQQNELKNNGELLKTAFEIMGRGTQITLTIQAREEIFKSLVIQNRISGNQAPPGQRVTASKWKRPSPGKWDDRRQRTTAFQWQWDALGQHALRQPTASYEHATRPADSECRHHRLWKRIQYRHQSACYGF